ncbi:replication factor A protein, partial [Trifolium medium]|nr:replication factor A protein [Trifolium medium]
LAMHGVESSAHVPIIGPRIRPSFEDDFLRISVTPDSGAYYCMGCVKHVFHMVLRYKVKVHVSDGTDDAENVSFCPPEMSLLKGKKLVFKVEKCSEASSIFDGSFRVRRWRLLHDDPGIWRDILKARYGSLTPAPHFGGHPGGLRNVSTCWR